MRNNYTAHWLLSPQSFPLPSHPHPGPATLSSVCHHYHTHTIRLTHLLVAQHFPILTARNTVYTINFFNSERQSVAISSKWWIGCVSLFHVSFTKASRQNKLFRLHETDSPFGTLVIYLTFNRPNVQWKNWENKRAESSSNENSH